VAGPRAALPPYYVEVIKWKSLFVVALSAALLVACGKAVTSGTVTSKNYQPPDTVYEDICVSYDRKGNCAAHTVIPRTQSAVWELCLRDDTPKKGVLQPTTGCVEVSQADFERYEVGQHYP